MSLQEQIKSNKRKSGLLFSGFLVIYLVIGWAVSYWYGDGAVIVAAIIALIIAATAIWWGDDLAVSIARGRLVSERADAPELWDAVETMSIAAGIEMPRVYISSDPGPNAFAAGRTHKQALVCVNIGLLRLLDKEELEGVIAHEISHIRNYDVRLMTYAAVLAGSIAILSYGISRLMIFGGRDSRSGGGGNIILLAISLLAVLLAPLAAMIIQMAISRRREFVADASAADLTRYPEGLASALEQISGSPRRGTVSAATAHLYIAPAAVPKGISNRLFSTHPPTSERVERLLELSGGSRHTHSKRAVSRALGQILTDPMPSPAARNAKLPQPPQSKRSADGWYHSDDEGFA